LDTKQDTPGAVASEPKHGRVQTNFLARTYTYFVIGTLEAGHIYFLYRPKVEVEDPQSIDDVSK
jgi:hypothetical protein